jgi:threonine/homoserine/homoserine lactone efflux protein
MSTERLAALVVFAFVSSITPGPNNLMLMASGLNYGVKRTLPHMLGVGGGFTLMLVGVGRGFGALFGAVPAAQGVIKLLCLIYLLYLAYRMTKAGPVNGANGVAQGRPMRAYEAVAFQWVNPKAWAMALTAFATYAESSSLGGTLWVAGAFGLVNLPCVAAWVWFGRALRRVLRDPERVKWFNWTMAALLILSVVPFLR